MKKTLLLLPFLFTILSCTHAPSHVEKAFYFWKNDYGLAENEAKVLNEQQVNKLYVKFFEVETTPSMGIFPTAKSNLNFRYNSNDSVTIVPTVYIRNEVFLENNRGAIDSLADNVNFLIGKYQKEKFENSPPFSEYQMDCDWTLKSKENYFYFLKRLKAISKKKISCTLRLYPYKYSKKMGIPPVDKAMLMCYNLMNPLENKSKNSILDNPELDNYLVRKTKYPLHLDVALPIYSWMQVYQNNRFSTVIYNNAKSIAKIIKPDKTLWYEVTKDSVLNGV